MGRAYSWDLAWRVVWAVWNAEVFEPDVPYAVAHDIEFGPLAVGRKGVQSIWTRFWTTGNVETHQGQRVGPAANRVWTIEHDIQLVKTVVAHPRWQAKEHCAAVCAETGVGRRLRLRSRLGCAS